MKRISIQWIALALTACLQAGCSAYQATRSEDDGGYQPDGSYVLTQAEHAQDCRGLKGWIEGYAESVRKLGLRQAGTQSQTSRSLFSSMKRLSGRRETNSTAETICRQYAIMTAMNRELQNRRCETVDIAAALAPGEGVRAVTADTSNSGKAWGIERAPTLAEYRSASAPAICGAP